MNTQDKLIDIKCDCGFNLGIREFDLDEIAAGVWGTIPCPKCNIRLNPKIQDKQQSMVKLGIT